MKYTVTYCLSGCKFRRECSNIAEAYEAVSAILGSGITTLPDTNEERSKYMEMLVSMKLGETLSYENHYFGIHVKED